MPDPGAAPPRVAVLMATLDGRPWIAEQVDTVLGQQGVQVRLVVSDDGSTDGTWEWLVDRAAADPRVELLSRHVGSGVAANFHRLLRDVRLADGELVALADQDDRWLPDKLAAEAATLAAGSDGVSSDVTAFWPDGRRAPIRKSQPQRRWDYLLESAGPGCTFLLSPRMVDLARAALADRAGPAAAVGLHDWLVYALCRARGWRWTILDRSTVDYRQHAHNHLGANVGLRSAVERLRMIRRGWHREGALLVARAALEVARAAGDPVDTPTNPQTDPATDPQTGPATEPVTGAVADAPTASATRPASDRPDATAGIDTLAASSARPAVPPPTADELAVMVDLLSRRDLRSRWRLALRVGQLRRRPRDRVVLAALLVTGLW
ncbi:glycosyltransferase [Nakamurella endophytica]|uniref:Glycosyltransferase 2-like domain-containing protein n=1 Tax=Nakamurella endophytica TaxID=1748367 RepID=A0A917SVW6_9ACTN|nr:glycosyltransferase [Nakamurella endophytica]GGM01408.1 hypothetical protein GCM10011594_21870 [Nakamurella endophytica]